MGWMDDRDRRRRPRIHRQEPTYLVERDGPHGYEPIPYWRRWIRRAADFVHATRVDAYPDHARPFEGRTAGAPPRDDPPVDEAAVARRLPRPKAGKVRLLVVSGDRMRSVLPKGWTLERVDLTRRASQLWVLGEIERATAELAGTEDDMEHTKGQGLAEYALILALIAIVAIVALTLIGNQIAQALSSIGVCLVGGC